MESDFVALTDMINAKMLGMFDLIDKWIPQNNTIKKTLLQDINFIGQEIKLFHTKDNNIKDKKLSNGCLLSHKNKNKCRNGKNCWYLKQGRCWFFHDHETSNMKDKLKQHDLHSFFQSEKKQLSINQFINTNSSNNNNKDTTNTTITTNRNKNKNKCKSHAKSQHKFVKSHTSSNHSKKKIQIPKIPLTVKISTIQVPASHLHREKNKEDDEKRRKRRNQALTLLIFWNVSHITIRKTV